MFRLHLSKALSPDWGSLKRSHTGCAKQAAAAGRRVAPRTEAYSSGLCLFIWKCYSPLSNAVKKGLQCPWGVRGVGSVPCNSLPWVNSALVRSAACTATTDVNPVPRQAGEPRVKPRSSTQWMILTGMGKLRTTAVFHQFFILLRVISTKS